MAKSKAPERQRVVDRSISVDLYGAFEDTSIEQTVQHILQMAGSVNYGAGETEKFRVDSYYDRFYVYMDVYRDETDKEFEKRLAKEEAARKKLQEARDRERERARKVLLKTKADERAEYERLRAKFEKQ